MEEQIFQTLLEFYKERGLDTHILMENPLFMGLSTPMKIQLLKKYASQLEETNSRSISRDDIKGMLKEMGWSSLVGAGSGTIGALSAAKMFAGGRVDPKMIALIGGASALAGAVGYGISAADYIGNRQKMHGEFQRLKRDPSDSNAIKTLAAKTMASGARPPGASFSNIIGKVKSRLDRISTDDARQYGSDSGILHNLDKDPAPGTNLDTLTEAIRKMNARHSKN